jgi:cytochrome c oxidase subunit I+III
LEWLGEIPDKPWGVRSIPEIDGRYPLWDQPNLMRDVDQGRFFLPDAEEGKRETLVTSVIDARPLQCLRVPGPTFLTLWAAVFTGAAFIVATFHWWQAAAISTVAAFVSIVAWLWSGTAPIPEQDTKDVGLGVTLPLYTSGPSSVGWWAMFIMMLADITAFMSLVFGYFFYWTIHDDFPPDPVPGPGCFWPTVAAGLLFGSWLFTALSRQWNHDDRTVAVYTGLSTATLLSLAGSGALFAGPWCSRLDPTRNVYDAIVWLLVIWTIFHVAIGAIMQVYCVCRRWAGRMTARHDADITNVTLYWHFTAMTVVVTAAVIAGFPLVA